jgi:hypothetical protein
MNPELEALIRAYLAVAEANEDQLPQLQADFNELCEAALQNRPGVSRERFTQALRRRAQVFVKAQSRPPSLPPRA